MRDVSFANNQELSSGLGHVIVLTDDARHGDKLSYARYKSKSVVRSVLGVETYAFADCFNQAYSSSGELLRIMHRRVPLAILTDCCCLFNVIVRLYGTLKRRMLMDLAAARDALDRGEFDDFGWIRAEDNTV